MIIEKVSDIKDKFDGCIATTIKDIVRVFFKKSENSMIYICDDSDKKARTRFNTFERWYLSSTMTDYITKVDNVIKFNSNDEVHTLYTSLLFHNENTNINTILEIYNTIEKILTEDK